MFHFLAQCIKSKFGIFGIGRNLSKLRFCVPVRVAQFKEISTSSYAFKQQKGGHDKKKIPSMLESSVDSLKPAIQEMKKLEEHFLEELDKRLSFRTDSRLYEDFYVNSPDGQRHRLANLAQISRKGTQTIVVNFSKNPAFISHAKIELQKTFPDINVQQEGTFLYIKTPQITRERRKEMIQSVKHSLLNDYKKTLNTVYSKYTKKFESNIKSKDEIKKNGDFVLDNKRIMDSRADAFVKEREDQLMAELI